jgi:hypothetical protein
MWLIAAIFHAGARLLSELLRVVRTSDRNFGTGGISGTCETSEVRLGEHMMQYNARKQEVVRESYHRAFVAAGLLDE